VLELVLAKVISAWDNPCTFTPQFARCHPRTPAYPHFTHNLCQYYETKHRVQMNTKT